MVEKLQIDWARQTPVKSNSSNPTSAADLFVDWQVQLQARADFITLLIELMDASLFLYRRYEAAGRDNQFSHRWQEL